MFTTIEITLLALIFACVIVSACFWFLYMHELNKYKNNRTNIDRMNLTSAANLIDDTKYDEARALLSQILKDGDQAEAKRAQSLLNDISWRQMQAIHDTQDLAIGSK